MSARTEPSFLEAQPSGLLSPAVVAAQRRLLWIFGLIATLAIAYIYCLGLTGPPIRSDGIGYQAYLPALFIDHDLTFAIFAERRFGGPIPWWTGIAIYPESGIYLDKYPIGTAVLQAPFFLVADGLTQLLGMPRSGFSAPYQIANIVSGIFYFILGAYVLLKILLDYFELRIALLTTWLIALGTNLFHYATYDGGFSHVYSFALIAIYIHLLLKYSRSPELSLAPAAGIAFGLIVITRPQNAILGLLALGIWIQTAQRTPSRSMMLRDGAAFMLAALLPMIPQLACWWLATGHFLVYSYQDEGFIWTRPRILSFLFGVRKGLFFWSPALLLAVAGFALLPRRLRVFGAWAFACMLLHVYISSSWHMWWFGGGFGSRTFTDMLAVLALPMAAAIAVIVERVGFQVVRIAAVALVGLNFVLMNGYWVGFIPFDGTTAGHLLNVPATYYELLTKYLRPI
jgi:hypothetical protein